MAVTSDGELGARGARGWFVDPFVVGWPYEPVTGYAAQLPDIEDHAELREPRRRVGPIFEEAGIAGDLVLAEARWSDTPAPEPALT